MESGQKIKPIRDVGQFFESDVSEKFREAGWRCQPSLEFLDYSDSGKSKECDLVCDKLYPVIDKISPNYSRQLAELSVRLIVECKNIRKRECYFWFKRQNKAVLLEGINDQLSIDLKMDTNYISDWYYFASQHDAYKHNCKGNGDPIRKSFNQVSQAMLYFMNNNLNKTVFKKAGHPDQRKIYLPLVVVPDFDCYLGFDQKNNDYQIPEKYFSYYLSMALRDSRGHIRKDLVITVINFEHLKTFLTDLDKGVESVFSRRIVDVINFPHK